jgi:ParB family transcriptional regulator, chromosome partitioning protein
MSNDLIQFLPINQLQPNPFQPRSKIKKEDLEELVQSVIAYGILEPLVIADSPAGYQIIAGERRWRAAKEAGLTEVPVFVKKTTPKGMLEMALVENVQRTDLSPIERAQAFQQLIRQFGYNTSNLAEKVGKSDAYISNSLKLIDLPDAVKDGLLGNLISEGHARALSSIPDERTMVECYKVILKEGASVRRAEELARKFKKAWEKQLRSPVRADRGRPIVIDENQLKQWESNFKSLFHTDSNFKLIRSRRQTRVTITLYGGPEETDQDLNKILKFAEARKK